MAAQTRMKVVRLDPNVEKRKEIRARIGAFVVFVTSAPVLFYFSMLIELALFIDLGGTYVDGPPDVWWWGLSNVVFWVSPFALAFLLARATFRAIRR